MYCFQESLSTTNINFSVNKSNFESEKHNYLPDSRPPPVSFSPPKAPPISAPLVPIFTLAIPQSEPLGPIHLKALSI
jgi:hypothetical protein